MKIAIVGYGKMGKIIETTAQKAGHEIVSKIDVDNQYEFDSQEFKSAEAVIEFSTPQAAFDNIMKCFERKISVVSGTTGWLNRFDEIKNTCQKNQLAFFYASNFSIGVNILFQINKKLASIMNVLENYEVEIDETHHIHKLDSPSGTAITLAETILSEIERKKKWTNNLKSKKEILNINSFREDEITGNHSVKYISDVDEITISHSAKNRNGFAIGAIKAAEFIREKKGIFTMSDLLNY